LYAIEINCQSPYIHINWVTLFSTVLNESNPAQVCGIKSTKLSGPNYSNGKIVRFLSYKMLHNNHAQIITVFDSCHWQT